MQRRSLACKYRLVLKAQKRRFPTKHHEKLLCRFCRYKPLPMEVGMRYQKLELENCTFGKPLVNRRALKRRSGLANEKTYRMSTIDRSRHCPQLKIIARACLYSNYTENSSVYTSSVYQLSSIIHIVAQVAPHL